MLSLSVARSVLTTALSDIQTKLDAYTPRNKSEEYLAWVLQINIDRGARAKASGSVIYMRDAAATLESLKGLVLT